MIINFFTTSLFINILAAGFLFFSSTVPGLSSSYHETPWERLSNFSLTLALIPLIVLVATTIFWLMYLTTIKGWHTNWWIGIFFAVDIATVTYFFFANGCLSTYC